MSADLRVLLVEDSADDADLMHRQLKAAFGAVHVHRVEAATALNHALNTEQWDLVLSDYGMPEFSGMEALKLVKAAKPDMPFILVTGTIGEEAAVEALKAGVDDYVLKSNLLRLASCIERQLQVAEDRRARRRSEEALRESEQRFRQLAENINSFFYLTDPANREMFYVSPAYEEMWGKSMESLYRDARSWLEAVHPDDRERVAEDMRLSAVEAIGKSYRIIRPDGSIRWIRSRAFPIADATGKTYRVAGIVEDDTERKAAEDKIARLNRVYAVLSGINSLIAREPSREELFQEACRIAVEDGGLRMAWLGIYHTATLSIVPVASHGHEAGFIRLISLSVDDPAAEGRGLVRRAVREKRAVIVNDMAEDRKFRLRKEAQERGYGSGAVLPLIVAGDLIGVLALFAREPHFFDESEMRLLGELAGDISFAVDHINKSEKLDYLAYYDGLTGLANRTLLLERLGQSIRTPGSEHHHMGLIVCDLERFRAVNDSLGRQAGDALLSQFSRRLLGCVTDATHLARIEADCFAILLPEVKSELDAARILGDLAQRCLREPFHLGDDEVRLSAKAGIALFPSHGTDAEALLRNAKAALKRCKQTGERHLFFRNEMTERVAEKLRLETRLRRAIEREEFVLHYQPRVLLGPRTLQGVEALIRWQTDEGLVPPMNFIPLLEETGLILEVGAWALRQAVKEHRDWRDRGLRAPRVAVNVSAVQLRQRDFVSRVKRAIERGAVPPGIDLEITESMVMDDIAGNIEKLRALRDLGLNIAIDDFGTGYSSLAYLAKLPVNSLKIDRSFVITMLKDSGAMTLVATIVSLAHSLGLKVVAEGVDSEDQAETLARLGCDEMQGYLLSKPLPLTDLTALLQS